MGDRRAAAVTGYPFARSNDRAFARADAGANACASARKGGWQAGVRVLQVPAIETGGSCIRLLLGAMMVGLFGGLEVGCLRHSRRVRRVIHKGSDAVAVGVLDWKTWGLAPRLR
ncbi:hypothetical protein GCM10009534_39300 [Kribbella sandramycini]